MVAEGGASRIIRGGFKGLDGSGSNGFGGGGTCNVAEGPVLMESASS